MQERTKQPIHDQVETKRVGNEDLVTSPKESNLEGANPERSNLENSNLVKARNLTLLGIILQSLHVLFGVTLLIGVLITQTRLHSTSGTAYHSQLKWQFVTFWLALTGYAFGFYIWINHANYWVVVGVLALIVYRLGVSVWYWRLRTPIKR